MVAVAHHAAPLAGRAIDCAGEARLKAARARQEGRAVRRFDHEVDVVVLHREGSDAKAFALSTSQRSVHGREDLEAPE